MNTDELIYLDYQASTPLCAAAKNAMLPFLDGNFSNPHSAQHIGGMQATSHIEIARHQVAALIGSDPNEIIFTSGATEASNLALLGIRHTAGNRKRVLIGSTEHKCVIEPANYLNDLGFSVEHIPVDTTGTIDLATYEMMLSDDVALVSIMMANNETGSIQAISHCAKLAKKVGAIFHTDAAQAPISMDITVEELGVDLLSLSSHKMYGPKGIGALYVSKETIHCVTPLIRGGGQEQGLRSGTLPTLLCVGFGEAAKYLFSNTKTLRAKILHSRNLFWEMIGNKVSQVSLLGQPLEARHIGNLCLTFEGVSGDELLGMLASQVAASTGSACTSGMTHHSHVLSAMNLSKDKMEGAVRFSFGPDIPNESLAKAVDEISKAVKILRQNQ